jgi:branched-chain amino acid transport system ATP-binding protein
MTAPLLRCEGLGHSFGAVRVLNGVTFVVGAGERRAIIGPNGAGKTTLFDTLTGHLRPATGTIALDGRPITGLAPHRIARLGLARSFQRNNLFPVLSVAENLRLAAARGAPGNTALFRSTRRTAPGMEAARAIARRVALEARLGERAGRLSHGEQRQLEIGIALATGPRLLLLDEPTAGMSPDETARMTELLAALPAELTMLIIEHDMDVVFTLADRVTVLHHGEVLADGPPEAVRTDPRVRAVYLGDGALAPG